MNRITTLPALQSLQDETIVYSLIMCIIAIGIACLVANLIPYKSNGRSYITRRIWFVIIGLICSFGFYMYNDLSVKPTINNVGWQSMFSETNVECLFIILIGYIVVSVILMFIFRNSKFGSILGKVKK